MFVPRDDEEHTVLGPKYQSRVRVNAALGNEEMHAFGCAHTDGTLRRVESLTGPDARGVDHVSGPNLNDRSWRLQVVNSRARDARFVVHEIHKSSSRGDVRSVGGGAARNVQRETGVVDLSVVIND